MLRSHHLRLYSNTHKKLKRSVAAEYPGRCVAGVYKRRFKVLYGVIALSSDVSPYLVLGVPLVSGSLLSL
jgi:hypothetical protein